MWFFLFGSICQAKNSVPYTPYAEMKAAWNAVISYNLISSFLNAKKKEYSRSFFIFNLRHFSFREKFLAENFENSYNELNLLVKLMEMTFCKMNGNKNRNVISIDKTTRRS